MLEASQIGKPIALTVNVSPSLSLAEGPLWNPCDDKLMFVDVNASKLYEIDDAGTVTTLASNTGRGNGTAFDIDGSLIIAQMSGHIGRRDSSGMIHAIEPPGGPALHTPDDVIVRADGTIYFTDFSALAVTPVYQLPRMSAKLINGGMVLGPNGIELSPDETILYVAAYSGGSIVKFSVAQDGALTPAGTFASGLSNPDSFCLDAAGNLYVGVSSGLQVFRPDGTSITLIPATSLQGTTNCTFGGAEGKTLYITAWTRMYKVERMPIPGLDWVKNKRRLSCS